MKSKIRTIITIELSEKEARELLKALDNTYDKINELTSEEIYPPTALDDFKNILYCQVDE